MGFWWNAGLRINASETSASIKRLEKSLGEISTKLSALDELVSQVKRDAVVLHCGFCGKSQHYVRRLISGHGCYICNECVAVCVDVIGAAE